MTNPTSTEAAALAEAARTAAKVFRNYEALHRAKGTSEGNTKAYVNLCEAEALEEKIAAYDASLQHPDLSGRTQAQGEPVATSRGCVLCGCPVPNAHYEGCTELRIGFNIPVAAPPPAVSHSSEQQAPSEARAVTDAMKVFANYPTPKRGFSEREMGPWLTWTEFEILRAAHHAAEGSRPQASGETGDARERKRSL